MQEAACLNFGDLQDDITIATTRCCSNDVLVEWEGDEGYENQKVY